MSFLLPYSEESLLRRLDAAMASDPEQRGVNSKQLRRLRHKLRLRRLQRHKGLPNFDWDAELAKRLGNVGAAAALDGGG